MSSLTWTSPLTGWVLLQRSLSNRQSCPFPTPPPQWPSEASAPSSASTARPAQGLPLPLPAPCSTFQPQCTPAPSSVCLLPLVQGLFPLPFPLLANLDPSFRFQGGHRFLLDIFDPSCLIRCYFAVLSAPYHQMPGCPPLCLIRLKQGWRLLFIFVLPAPGSGPTGNKPLVNIG